jgi:hypothetical protein
MVVEALQARLKFLENEILQFTKLAAQANETVERTTTGGWHRTCSAKRESYARGLRKPQNSQLLITNPEAHSTFPFPLVPRATTRASPASASTSPIFRPQVRVHFSLGLSL